MTAFHDVLFPMDVALGARGGPERRTDIVVTGSGAEARNARWAHSRRRWNAGYGVRRLDQLAAVVAFFEERRGRLHGFRWRDRLDHSSAAPGTPPGPLDQRIGTGDGVRRAFALSKTYGAAFAPYARPIAKPVAGSVRVAVGGVATTAFGVDAASGLVTLATAPPAGAAITAGFLFDVPGNAAAMSACRGVPAGSASLSIPDYECIKPGDVILSRHLTDGFQSQETRAAQERHGFARHHAIWTHAMLYAGGLHVVEANKPYVPNAGVQVAPITRFTRDQELLFLRYRNEEFRGGKSESVVRYGLLSAAIHPRRYDLMGPLVVRFKKKRCGNQA